MSWKFHCFKLAKAEVFQLLACDDPYDSLEFEDPGNETPPPNLSPVRLDPNDIVPKIAPEPVDQSEAKKLEAKCPECEEVFDNTRLVEMIKHIRDAHGRYALIRWRIVPREIMPLQVGVKLKCFWIVPQEGRL